MPSYLQKKEGVYDVGKRYAFTNISEEPFPIMWNSQIVRVVEPHETIEISDATPYPGPGNGDAIARTKTIELATRVILGEAKIDADKLGLTTNKGYISPIGTRALVPEARKPYEQKILQELAPSENIHVLEKLKADELIGDTRRQAGVSYSSAPTQFVNAPKLGEVKSNGEEFQAEIPKVSEDVIKTKSSKKNETSSEQRNPAKE